MKPKKRIENICTPKKLKNNLNSLYWCLEHERNQHQKMVPFQLWKNAKKQNWSSPSLKNCTHLATKRYKTAGKTEITWLIKWVINKKSSWKITHWEWNIKWAFRWENKSRWKLAIQQWEKRNNRWRRYENCRNWRWYLMHWKETMERDVSQEQHYFIKVHWSKHWVLTWLGLWSTY